MKKSILLNVFLIVAATLIWTGCGDDDGGGGGVDPIQPIIASFSITAPVQADGVINGTNITVTVPAGTDVSSLTTNVVVPVGATVSPASGTTEDFTNPVTYTVTGNDSDGNAVTQDYTVTAEIAAPTKIGFLSFESSEANVTEADESAALAWAKATYGNDFKFVSLSGIASQDLADVLVLFWYQDRNDVGGRDGFRTLANDADLAVIQTWYENGGNVLLSGQATAFVDKLGRWSEVHVNGLIFGDAPLPTDPGYVGRPKDDVWTVTSDLDPTNLADTVFNTASTTDWNRSSHPLFSGLTTVNLEDDSLGYVYPTVAMLDAYTREDHNSCWDLNNDDIETDIGHTPGDTDFWARADKFEAQYDATVLAAWGQVQDFCCAMIIEFNPVGNSGKMLAIGPAAYDWDNIVEQAPNDPGDGNSFLSNIQDMTGNGIDYLATP